MRDANWRCKIQAIQKLIYLASGLVDELNVAMWRKFENVEYQTCLKNKQNIIK